MNLRKIYCAVCTVNLLNKPSGLLQILLSNFQENGFSKMKKIILALLLSPSFLFAQWVEQQVPSGIHYFTTVDFANLNTGAAGGRTDPYGKIIYTTNSGINWIMAQFPDSLYSVSKIQLVNSSTGYLSGAYYPFPLRTTVTTLSKNSYSSPEGYRKILGIGDTQSTYKGIFLKTTNGGKNWFTYGTLPSNVYFLLGMCFVNVNTGFTLASLDVNSGVRNSVLKTTNGGLSWNNVYTLDSAYLNNIFSLDGNSVFVAGGKSSGLFSPPHNIIAKSTNGGSYWSLNVFQEIGEFFDISFANASTGFAVTYDTSITALIYKTTNSGLNWAKLPFHNSRSVYYSIEFLAGTGRGIAAGAGGDSIFNRFLIARTTNYGSNWTNYTIQNTICLLQGSSMVDANNWYVCGFVLESGAIFRTTNGGEPIGIEPISNEIPKNFSLFQNYPNPFNPVTKIKFDTPPQPSPSGRGQWVKLIIYDILGREIAVLVNEQLKPGTYEVEWDGSDYPSGVYFYQLSINNERLATKKMVLIK